MKKDKKHEYGCVMLYFDFPSMFKIQDIINPKDIYEEEDDDTYGLEEHPHTTLLLGLHEGVTVKQIKGVLDNYIFDKCVIDNPSLFESENYDVLKFDVWGKGLKECNKDLMEFPYTNNFPEYHPHMTIAYLKKGKGKKYIETLDDKNANNFKATPNKAVYSMSNGIEIDIPIKFG